MKDKLIQLRFDEILISRINNIANHRNMSVTSLLISYITDCLIKDEIMYKQLYSKVLGESN